jgi:isocitrate dehydrogenase
MHTITLLPGDGIGPEVTDAVRDIFTTAKIPVQWDVCQAGMESFKAGIESGVPEATIASIQRTKTVLKGPLTTPIGYGNKSANVTLRKLFSTYANTRPVQELPHILTPYKGCNLNFWVVRENLEDLYAGVEYNQTAETSHALKVITQQGSEKVIRYAFELARAHGFKSVHCATKANILKLTEGRFKKVFEWVAKDYPDIMPIHILIDNCAHQLVVNPNQFEVIVTTNLNGDIITDLASGLVGGLGVAPSANIGSNVSIFEAVHGAAPDIAGKGIANPTGLLLSACLMLDHLGLMQDADRIRNALYSTFEAGIFTGDLAKQANVKGVSTKEFTQAIIDHLGKTPSHWMEKIHKPLELHKVFSTPTKPVVPQTIGIDVLATADKDLPALGLKIEQAIKDLPFKLHFISTRSVIVYPKAKGEVPDFNDGWRLRFLLKDNNTAITDEMVAELLSNLSSYVDWVNIQKLQTFGAEEGFTRAQGED